jgi:stress response protein SCP2
MAACQQLHYSPAVNVCFGWVPLPVDDSSIHLDICLLFFDARGNLVDIMSRQMGLSNRKGCGGRVERKDGKEMMMGFCVFGSKQEYFVDWINLSLSLDRLQTDISSIAFLVLSRDSLPIGAFPRKHLRLVDTATKRELMIYPYDLEGMPKDHAWLLGGLISCEGTWAFHPALKTFAFEGWDKVHKPGSNAWYDVLQSSGQLTPQPTAEANFCQL